MKRKDGFSGQQAIVIPETVIGFLEKNPLTSSLHITDIGYYPFAEYHFRERKEGIPQHVLIYCIKGKGWFEINGVKKVVNENQFFILPANKPHAYGTDEGSPWTIYWIHFKGSISSYFIEDPQLYPKNITPGEDSCIESRNQLFEKIYSTLEMGYSVEHLQYANLCFHHYLASLMYIHFFEKNVVDNRKEQDYTTLSIHYMRENIEKKLKVEDIAAHLELSTSYYSTLFQKNTGYSPINYLNNLRIQLACQHLDFTEMKINQICHKIGYEDAYYFSRVFTKIMGISPREYRLRKKG